MYAVENGNLEEVRLLLDKGANVKAWRGQGLKALKIGQKKGLKEIAELLRAHGAKE